MSLLDDLVRKYAAIDLAEIFSTVGLEGIDSDNYEDLQEITLAQWLLESARATSQLAITAHNFAGLKWRPEMQGFATPLSINVPSEPISVDFCKFSDLDAFILGYWKFLTRSPYQGLVNHTNSPANFIGFLQSKGFAVDIGYVNKVLRLLPEAHDLLASARGAVIPDAPENLLVTASPAEVEVGQAFIIEGTASQGLHGQNLLIQIDALSPVSGAVIAQDGKWKVNYIFNRAGRRKIQISVGTEHEEIEITAVDPVRRTNGAVKIKLNGSVGVHGVNKAADVKAVKKRLYDLGYTWVGDANSASLHTGFLQSIRLFQSIIAGLSKVNGDGRVDVGGPTHRWLEAVNAPRWTTMPDSEPSINFVNYEKSQTNDDHDFGTSWISEVITAIARDYNSSSPGTAPFTINDVSRPKGGDTGDHAGHETGLMCDVLLPRTDGKSGGIVWSSSSFNRNATRELIKSIRKQKLVRQVFFNDPTLREEIFLGKKLCNYARGHDNHIHFEINPPVKT